MSAANAHDQSTEDSLQPGVADAPSPPGEVADVRAEAALSVAGAARGLGVAPATLRSWERRYGIAPSLHTKGGHRRYGPEDLAKLQVMHRLVRDGVPPAEAARVAMRSPAGAWPTDSGTPFAALLSTPADSSVAPAVAAADGAPEGAPAAAGAGSPGGGRVLSMPHGTPAARGLARAAMALDAHSCQRTVDEALASQGALATWEGLIRPVLVSLGNRWAQTGRGVEIEHSFSVVVTGCLARHAARLGRPHNVRPVLLASVAEELHDLPLLALHACLADEGIRSHVIGARTPEEALADAMQRLGPPVVFLWSQMRAVRLPDLPAMRPAPALVVGGPGWAETPDDVTRAGDLPDALGAVRTAMGL
jgi:hypothetical protein